MNLVKDAVSDNYLSTLRPSGSPIKEFLLSSSDALLKSERQSVIEWFAYNLFCAIFEFHVKNPNRKLKLYMTPLQLKIGYNNRISDTKNGSKECIGLTTASIIADKAIRIVQANLDMYLNFDYISLNPDDFSRVDIDIPENVFKNLKFLTFSSDIKLYQMYLHKKAIYLSQLTTNFRLQQLTDWIVCKLMQLIIKMKKKDPDAIENKNHQIFDFTQESNCASPALSTAFKIVTKAIKIVLTNLDLPTWSRTIRITSDPSHVILDFSKDIIKEIKVPLGNNFNKIYLTKSTLIPKVDLSYLRPSGPRLYKMVIHENEQPNTKQKAVNRYAFNLMKAILRNAKRNPGQAIVLQFEPLQFSSESSPIAKSVAKEAISIVIDRLQINTFFSTCIDQISPSLVSIKISSDLAKKIKFPIPGENLLSDLKEAKQIPEKATPAATNKTFLNYKQVELSNFLIQKDDKTLS